MTKLNLQKIIVKNIFVRLIIITISTLLLLLPISIVLFYKGVEHIQNNVGSFFNKRLALLPVIIIILIIEISLLVVWISRYFTFKKITFPNEESKTVYCKKIFSIKIFSTIGLKIKTEHTTLLYILSKDNESLDSLKKELLHKTILLKCYQNTNIIKRIDKKSIQPK